MTTSLPSIRLKDPQQSMDSSADDGSLPSVRNIYPIRVMCDVGSRIYGFV